MRRVAAVGLLLSLVCRSASAATPVAWTEAVAGGWSVRTIAEGACPALLIDGHATVLEQRAAAVDKTFPAPVCQTVVPAGARLLTLDGTSVPAPKPAVKRIVVLGDTGCRIKKGKSGVIVQDCDDTTAWPFAQIARSAATEQPDLVIHVGDYYYRESACPDDHKGCEGSPHGDDWQAWSADFFAPAAPLLAVAPWVFVRGNHEQCGRGGVGWFRLLDAGAAPLTCPAAAAPFAVDLGALKLYVVDSADTEDQKAPADKVALFRGELDRLEPDLGTGQGWVLTHRPIWGFAPPAIGPEAGEVGEGVELPMNLTEQAAADGEELDGIRLILSGHVHLFASADFAGKRPPQLIVGNGGDLRDGELPGIQTRNVPVDGMQASSFVVEQFGYMVLDLGSDGWHGALKRADGSTLATCVLAGRALSCKAA